MAITLPTKKPTNEANISPKPCTDTSDTSPKTDTKPDPLEVSKTPHEFSKLKHETRVPKSEDHRLHKPFPCNQTSVTHNLCEKDPKKPKEKNENARQLKMRKEKEKREKQEKAMRKGRSLEKE